MSTTPSIRATDIFGKIYHRAEDIINLPERCDYLSQDLYNSTRAHAASGKPLMFLPVTTAECYYPIDLKTGAIEFAKFSKRIYKIALFGILKSGEKVTVVLNELYPYFEIRVPEDELASRTMRRAREICDNEKLDLDHADIVSGQGFKKFNDNAEYVRLYFKSTSKRKRAIEIFRARNYDTAHDDLTNYFNVVCRDYMCSFTSWTTLRNYKVRKNHPLFNTDLVIDVDMNAENYEVYKGDIFEDPDLKNDRACTCVYDIETCDMNPNPTEIAQPDEPLADMFLIGLTFTFTDSDIFPTGLDPSSATYPYPKPKGHIASFAITNVNRNLLKPMPNRCIISVPDEKRMIWAMSILLKKFKPEYVIDFNGANYDMRWIIARAISHRVLDMFEENVSVMKIGMLRLVEKDVGEQHFVYPRNYEQYGQWFPSVLMKLSAELNMDGRILKYPGFIHIDSMMQLRRLAGNPEKYGLNAFLDRYKIGSKIDMPYKRMFAIYELCKWVGKRKIATINPADIPANIIKRASDVQGLCGIELGTWIANNMAQVIEYCIVDGIRLQDLMVKTSFIRDKRQLGVLSFVDFYSCVYRADGMKVRNITFAYGNRRNLHISNIGPSDPEKGKYPGAYVFQPKKGLVAPRFSIDEVCKLSSTNSDYVDWQPVAEATTDEDSSSSESESEYDSKVYSSDDEDGLPQLEPELPDAKPIEDHFDNATIRKMKRWIRMYGIRFADASPRAKRALRNLPLVFTEWLKSDHRYPVAGLDFSSLYPSIIMAFNMSPEKLVYTIKEAMHYRKPENGGWDTFPINFKFQGRDMKAWTIRHRYYEGCDFEDPAVNFGLFASILLTLFNQRADLKKQMKPYAEKLEELESLPKTEYQTAMQLPENQEVQFRYDYLNGKQKALKIMMNTFYGESGNSRSPIRVLEIAGGITSTAQEYIKKAAAYIVNVMGCDPYYGDTDSMYSSMSRKTFDKLDRAYYGGGIHRLAFTYISKYKVDNDAEIAQEKKQEKKDKLHEWFAGQFEPYLTDGAVDASKIAQAHPKELYYELLIHESINAIKIVNKEVNKYLAAESKGPFLKMAYEEFLYLCMFFGKKKYGGIPHEGGFNRRPKKLFIRGLELVKSGGSKLLVKSGMDILWKVFNIHNLESMITLVHKKIEEIYTTDHDFGEFIRSAMYKPKKQNISVQNFVQRMALLGLAPDAMERFNYVIVKKYPYKFDLKGRKTEIGVGDRMEFADRARELKMEIDLDYYMSGNIKGEMARFISYHKDFNIDPRDATEEAAEEAEKKATDLANKYITKYCERYSAKYVSKGPVLKSMWKRHNMQFQEQFEKITQCSLLSIYVNAPKAKRGKTEEDLYREFQVDMFTHLVDKARDDAKRESKNTALDYMRLPGNVRIGESRLLDLKRRYKTIVEERKETYGRIQPHILSKLRLQVNALNGLLSKRDNIIGDCINVAVGGIGMPEDVRTADQVATFKHRFESLSPDVINKNVCANIIKHITEKDLMIVNRVNKFYVDLYAANKLLYDAQAILEKVDAMCRSKLGDTSGVSRMIDLSDVNDFISQNF